MELSGDDLKAIRMPYPPIQIQRRIADYLDRETARLDGLTKEAEGTIRLVKERRSSLISATVAEGIDLEDVP